MIRFFLVLLAVVLAMHYLSIESVMLLIMPNIKGIKLYPQGNQMGYPAIST